MIYLDNAATTFPKPKNVLKETFKCIKEYCGNPGRSSHILSIKTSEKVYEARENVASFLNFDRPENVVFCQNATLALNIAIKSIIQPNSHVLISDLEHNSVLRPLHAISKKYSVNYSIFNSSGILEDNIKRLLKNNTKYIVSTLASNVIGREIDLSELSKIAKKYNLILITDASQLLGHKKVDLSETQCDALCSAGHKALFGIQGVGFVVFNKKTATETFVEGGSGNDSFNLEMPTDLPERYEAGTLSSPSIISLSAGIDFINNIGITAINEKIKFLETKYSDILLSFKKIKLYEHNNGVISFNFLGIPPNIVSEELNKYGICTRSGYHCSPLAHKTIGTIETGTVRIGLSFLNTAQESDDFYKALCSINKKFK